MIPIQFCLRNWAGPARSTIVRGVAKKDSADQTASEPSAEQPAKKGRPTRTRREAELANKRPLVPNDRKLAKQIEREKRNEAYARQQLALQTGDERYLPYRDKGKARRFTRDYIDARWSFSEFLLPMMLLFLVVSLGIGLLGSNPELATTVMLAVTVALYSFFVFSIAEGIWVWQKIKRRFNAHYPKEIIPKGTWFYCYSRMIMARRWRSPKPQAARGEFPDGARKTK